MIGVVCSARIDVPIAELMQLTRARSWLCQELRPPLASIAILILFAQPTAGLAQVPTITVAATDATATESGPTSATFIATRTGSTTGSLSVSFAMCGTAINVSDYNLSSGSFFFSAGATTAIVTLTPIQDSAIEGDETATLTLTANPNHIVGSPSSATATITSDDELPTITVAPTDNTATEIGPTAATFTATRTASATPLPAVSVSFTMGGTAINGSDYSLSSNCLLLPGRGHRRRRHSHRDQRQRDRGR